MDGNIGSFIIVFAILGCDCVLLMGHGLASPKITVLKHRNNIVEYEIDSVVDVVFAVELTVGQDIQCALVSHKH